MRVSFACQPEDMKSQEKRMINHDTKKMTFFNESIDFQSSVTKHDSNY